MPRSRREPIDAVHKLREGRAVRGAPLVRKAHQLPQQLALGAARRAVVDEWEEPWTIGHVEDVRLLRQEQARSVETRPAALRRADSKIESAARVLQAASSASFRSRANVAHCPGVS